jgi:hypothetical protein
MGRHDRHEQMVAGAEGRDADRPPFEIGNAADVFFAEQLEAADMNVTTPSPRRRYR